MVACNAPWLSAVIGVDGAVRLCFCRPAYGNIHEAGSLEAVVNSAEALQFRRELDVATNPICQRCVCSIKVPRSACSWL